MANWARLQIPFYCNRRVYDFAGETVVTGMSGQPMNAWADYDLAQTFLNLAKNAVSEESVQRVLSRGTGGSSGKITDLITTGFKHLANVYNALNVPMYMDPHQRMLFRGYMPGSPNKVGGTVNEALYGTESNYNSNWYQGGEAFPLGYQFSGAIPAEAQQRYRAQNPGDVGADPLRFMPTVMMGVVPDVRSYRDFLGGKTEYATTVMNGVGPQWTTLPDGTSLDLPGMSLLWPSHIRDANTLDAFYADGRNIYGTPNGYLLWLRDAIAGVESNIDGTPRDFDQIIFDARTYVTYYNTKQAQILGVDNFLNHVLTDDGRRAIEQPAIATTLRQIGEAAPAVGAAVGSVFGPLGSAIGGLIGGAISLVTRVGAATIHAPTMDSRDDLARPKPTLERGWLSGNPQADDEPPTMLLNAPRGIEISHAPTRTNRLIVCNSLVVGPQTNPPVTHLLGGQSTATNFFDKTLVKAGLAAAVGYGVYRLAKK